MIGFKQKSILLLLLLAGLSQDAWGSVTFGGVGGYSRGTLNRGEAEPIAGSIAQGFIGYNLAKWNFHGFFQHMDLGYTYAGETFSGVYSLSGVGLGYGTMVGKKGRISWKLQAPLTGTYVVVSESKGTINDVTYKYSTLTTLKGGTAYQGFLGYELLSVGRAESKSSEKAYVGLYLGYLGQTFTSQKTKIKTNNSALAPKSPGTETVSYALSLLSFSVSVNFNL